MIIVDRRSLLRAAAASMFVGMLPRTGQARPLWPIGGCCPLCNAVRSAFGQVGGVTATSGGGAQIVRSTGDPETDRLLGVSLARLARTFKVSPGFSFYDDSDGQNAFATPDNVLGEGKGSVLMGTRFFSDKMMNEHDSGITVLGVLAHEFAHIHQTDYGYQAALLRMDTTVRPLELHADYLAGYYLALRKSDRPDIDVQTVASVFSGMGDTNFNSPQHHGTPAERSAALSAG
jgi:hypothetical protein